MVEAQTAKNIRFVALIVQFIVLLIFPYFIWQLPLIIQILIAMLPPFWVPEMLYLRILVVGIWLIGWLVLYLWYRWYKTPQEHKLGLYLTSIYAIVLTGLLAGILMMIGTFLAREGE